MNVLPDPSVSTSSLEFPRLRQAVLRSSCNGLSRALPSFPALSEPSGPPSTSSSSQTLRPPTNLPCSYRTRASIDSPSRGPPHTPSGVLSVLVPHPRVLISRPSGIRLSRSCLISSLLPFHAAACLSFCASHVFSLYSHITIRPVQIGHR